MLKLAKTKKRLFAGYKTQCSITATSVISHTKKVITAYMAPLLADDSINSICRSIKISVTVCIHALGV